MPNAEDGMVSNGNTTQAPINIVNSNGSAHLDEDHDQFMATAARSLSMNDQHGDTVNGVPPSTLLSRRRPTNEGQSDMRLPSNQTQFLRPITPTEPLDATVNVDSAHGQTPTMDMLVREGPMTPTNTAGPFVFDGSAGRASGISTNDASAAA